MRRFALLAMSVGFLFPVLQPAPAHAQAIRTWVSGTGDDLNPCSRTSPCKTFQGALAVTAINGEINCVNAGGYGTLSITQSVTIDCTGTFGSILAAGIPAITINIPTGSSADPLRTVRLRGLSLNGAGTSGGIGVRSGTRGINILAAAVVTIEDVVISDFAQQGVIDIRTVPGKLFVRNSVIRNNSGVGVAVAASGGTNVVSLENVHSLNNLYGLAITTGNQVKATRSLFAGNSSTGVEVDTGAAVGLEHCTVNFNGVGLEANASATLAIADIDLSFNTTGITGTVISFGNNRIYSNTSAGTAPSVGAASTDHGQQ